MNRSSFIATLCAPFAAAFAIKQVAAKQVDHTLMLFDGSNDFTVNKGIFYKRSDVGGFVSYWSNGKLYKKHVKPGEKIVIPWHTFTETQFVDGSEFRPIAPGELLHDFRLK